MMCKPYLNRQSSGSVGKYYNKIEDKKNQQRLGGWGGGGSGWWAGEGGRKDTDRQTEKHVTSVTSF